MKLSAHELELINEALGIVQGVRRENGADYSNSARYRATTDLMIKIGKKIEKRDRKRLAD